MSFGNPDPIRMRPERRSPVRTAVPVVVAAWAVLEIWLLTVVARAAGGGTVVLLLLAGLVLGAGVAKRAGRRAWRGLMASLRSAEPAPGEGSGAAFELLGGLLLMVPGILSDAVGLLCLFPPSRALLSRLGGRALAGRVYPTGSWGDAFDQARMHQPDGKVVQGEVIREDVEDSSWGRDPDAPRPPLNR